MFARAIRAEHAPRSGEGAINVLNAVALAPVHIEASLRILALLPAQARANPMAQARALQAYAGEAGLGDEACAGAALHARVTALAKWTAAHDPGHHSNAEAVIEATARFPLSDAGDGIGFEPGGFQEMILFIEELPF